MPASTRQPHFALVTRLMAVVGLPAFHQFRPGRIDHHNVQIALSVLVVAATEAVTEAIFGVRSWFEAMPVTKRQPISVYRFRP